MDYKKRTKEIITIVICIIIIGAIYVGYTQFFNNKNTVKIISMELMKPEGGLNFTATVTIQNTGNNDINNAKLHFIFVKDNDIIDTNIQSVNLSPNLEGTYSAHFIDVSFEIENTYKTIASIYLENECLDTKTITKRF